VNLFDDYVEWDTPDGRLVARRVSEYKGLVGQRRVQLVDEVGRVYHYDKELVFERHHPEERGNAAA
jgi:hypothetical protein